MQILERIFRFKLQIIWFFNEVLFGARNEGFNDTALEEVAESEADVSIRDDESIDGSGIAGEGASAGAFPPTIF